MKRCSSISRGPVCQHFLMVNAFKIKVSCLIKLCLPIDYEDTVLYYFLEIVLPLTFRATPQACILAYIGCRSPYACSVGPVPFTKSTFPITQQCQCLYESVFLSLSLYMGLLVVPRFSTIS